MMGAGCRHGILLLLATALTGCATVVPDASFPDVKQQVAERTGQTVDWHLDAAEEGAAAVAVRRMLTEPLGPDRAVQTALLNNRRLQATYAQLGIAQADLVQAGLLRNPVFEGTYRFERNDGREIEAGVVDDFLHVLMIPMRKRLAEAALERTKMVLTGAVMDLALEVRSAVLRLQADRQMLRMRRTVLEAAEASYLMAHMLREAGNTTELDVLNRRALYEQAKLDVSAAEAAVLEGRERLNSLMGLLGEDTGWRVLDGLPDVPENPIDMRGLERRAIESSVDLAVAWREVELTARRRGMAKVTSVLPELEVGVEGERGGEGTWAIGPALALPIPLFDMGGPQRTAARVELRRAWDEYTALAVEIRAEVRAARHRLLTARRQALYYRDVILPLRQQITHQTQLFYNAMFVGVFQLLQAKQQAVEARRRYIEQLRDYWIARAELEQILNGRLVGAGQVQTEARGGAMAMNGGGH